MEFGIFSNGFRPHTTASQTYQEDLAEIVLADELGVRDAYISEHQGEPVYIGKVDTLPVPELLMCKAAAVTKRIRMGAAVKLIHLIHHKCCVLPWTSDTITLGGFCGKELGVASLKCEVSGSESARAGAASVRGRGCGVRFPCGGHIAPHS